MCMRCRRDLARRRSMDSSLASPSERHSRVRTAVIVRFTAMDTSSAAIPLSASSGQIQPVRTAPITVIGSLTVATPSADIATRTATVCDLSRASVTAMLKKEPITVWISGAGSLDSRGVDPRRTPEVMVIDWEARAKLLDEENDTLREEVRNLRKALIGAAEPRPYFNKTPSEMAIFGVLLNNRGPRAGSFMGARYSAPMPTIRPMSRSRMSGSARRGGNSSLSIAIKTHSRQCWKMTDDSKARARDPMAA